VTSDDGRHLALHALDVQLDLLHYYSETAPGLRYAAAILGQALTPDMLDELQPEMLSVARGLAGEVFSGDVFAVTGEILDVLEAAAPTIPSFNLVASDLPSKGGFIYFERPVYVTDLRGDTVVTRGLGWYTSRGLVQRELAEEFLDSAYGEVVRKHLGIVDHDELVEHVMHNEVVVLCALTDPTDPRDHMHERWDELTERLQRPPENLLILLAALQPLGIDFEPDTPRFNAPELPYRLFISFLRFIEERWVSSRVIAPDRPRVKRRARATKRPTPTTRVVQLRRSEHARHASESDEQHEWSCRWLVRGHWRMQAYGTGRALRRPTWIAEHIKGPEDKPLVVHDKIFSVER
jgi:hypothetical protein